MDLELMKLSELRDLAKVHGIKGRWDMNKTQLIDAIKEVTKCPEDRNIGKANQTQPEGCQKVTKGTETYIDNLEVGTIVAFKFNNRAMSGKFVGESKGRIILESKMGTKFHVEQEDIIWVRTGARWPKWVFNLFHERSLDTCQTTEK